LKTWRILTNVVTEEGQMLEGPDFHRRLQGGLILLSVDVRLERSDFSEKTYSAILVRALFIRAFLQAHKRRNH
jgi:hypothetical protein